MIAEIGAFAAVLAWVMSLAQGALGVAAANRPAGAAAAAASAQAVAVLLSIAFACLVTAFVRSDFSLAVVAANLHVDKPLVYRVAGTWGNHEDSMLLWSLILALFGATVGVFGRTIPSSLRARVIGILRILQSEDYVEFAKLFTPEEGVRYWWCRFSRCWSWPRKRCSSSARKRPTRPYTSNSGAAR